MQDNNFKSILHNIIAFSQQNSNLLEKYSDKFYSQYFQRKNIDRFAHTIKDHKKQILLEDFVKNFLCLIEHNQQETLFLSMSLIKLFTTIKQQTKNQNGIKFSDFTNYLCDKISEDDPDLILPTKYVPQQKMQPDISRIRDIDLFPPVIFNKTILQLPKISKDKKKKNKKLEEKKPIGKFIYSQSLKSIIVLGRLSSSIALFDLDLKVKRKIIPAQSKQMEKDFAILSFAYSQKYQRIGCIINNIGITFWQSSDQFKTQKVFSKSFGEKIYYLELFNQWITVDKNEIHYWDLKEQNIKQTIKGEQGSFINDLCQITHLRIICVSYTSNMGDKSLVMYKNYKQVSKLHLSSSGCHSLHFNKFTQSLLPIGYKNTISIYDIDKNTYDMNPVEELKGHNSIVSCITHIQNTSVIITGDDTGYIRIWQLNYMRCLQIIRVAKWLGSIACIGQYLIYADSRLNILPMDQYKPKQPEDIHLVYKFYLSEKEEFWFITHKDMRITDAKNGKTKKIYVVCSEEEQISNAIKLVNGILLGTSKGNIICYGYEGKKKWKIQAHQHQIKQLNLDREHRFFLTSSIDSNIYIWPEKTAVQNGPRKILNHSLLGKELNIIEISQKYNIMITGWTESSIVYIWDYQSLRLLYILQLKSNTSVIKICKELPFFAIATNKQAVFLIKFDRKQGEIQFELISVITTKSNYMHMSDVVKCNNYQKKTSLQQYEQSQIYIDLQVGLVSNILIQLDTHKKYLILNSNKGVLSCFNISKLIKLHFMKYINENKKQSNLINRPIKQSLERQLIKKNYLKLDIENMMVEYLLQPKLIWKKTIHKDTILHMDIIQFKQKYISTSCLDGYHKIIDLKTGELICSNNINYPLPIKWDLNYQNQKQIKTQIYNTMIVINNILKNYQSDLSVKQYQLIDISKFLETMIQNNYERSIQKPQKITLLNQQYTPQDIRREVPKQTSLKSYQAYKRVKLMRQDRKQFVPKQNYNSIMQNNHEQKQHIEEFLSPNFYQNLMNVTQQANDSNISRYYEGILKTKQHKNIIIGSFNIRRKREQSPKDFKKNNQSFGSLLNIRDRTKQVDKSVMNILKDINTKLTSYKQKMNVKNRSLMFH